MLSQSRKEIKIEDCNPVKNLVEKASLKKTTSKKEPAKAKDTNDQQIEEGQVHDKPPSLSRNRRFRLDLEDRQKSVSKSIARQASLSSLVDYTLKFLNDDMAINTVNQRGKLEHKEDKVIENLN